MSMAELLLILGVAVCVFNPAKLPMVAKHLGSIWQKINKLKTRFASMWQDWMNEEQLKENTQKALDADKHYDLKSKKD